MSAPINDGGYAFPQPDSDQSGWTSDDHPRGMSLRDWFAGMALAGLSANSAHEVTTKREAEIAYGQADEMIAERSKRK